MDPLVSVIVPVYNVRPFIQEAIDSIINQTYRNLEILLIDDGSTDGSGEICDEYDGNDSRVRVIHQDNRGLSAARNAGLDIMKGDLVAFLDPDDAFHSTFIEKTLSALLSEDADLVLCKYSVLYTTENIKNNYSGKKHPPIESGVYDRKETISELVGSKINVSVWNKVYRKNLWDSVRFSEGHVYEDIETTYVICSKIEKICVISDVLLFHRKRPGSITMDNSQNNIDDLIRSYQRTENFVYTNSPVLYSHEQVSVFHRRLFANYFHCFIKSRKTRGVSRKKYRDDLRNKIIETGKQYGVNELLFRDRMAYNMVCKCPWLFDICYPCYMTLSKAAHAVFRH